jgi:8-oxo-dGTP diphosphatase
MKIATLGIVIEGGKILLGEKKKGEIGIGKLSGPGGKLEAGDATLETCLVRETREEFDVELDPDSLELVALIDFYAASEIYFRTYVYRAKILSGEPHETEDMIPEWHPVDEMPFERMYEADQHWLPMAVSGEKFNANVYYREHAKNLKLPVEIRPFEVPV